MGSLLALWEMRGVMSLNFDKIVLSSVRDMLATVKRRDMEEFWLW
jgi:hypothetical protein